MAVTPDNLKEAQTYIDFVKTNLEPLAQQLKVSVEWLWNILVQQARVEAITYIVIGVAMGFLSTMLITIGFRTLRKAYVFEDQTKYDYGKSRNVKTGKKIEVVADESKQAIGMTCLIAAGLIILVSTITLLTSANTIVTGLVNPEYRAIEKIVEFSKPVAKEAQE